LNRFFDTSVMVALCQRNHPLHDAAKQSFVKSSPANSYCAAHSTAEFYSVMTRLPVRPMILPEQCLLLMDSLLERMTAVTLTAAEYRTTIQSCAEAGLAGGIVYDALLLACARKIRADVLYTFNPKDFLRLAPDWEKRIRAPHQQAAD